MGTGSATQRTPDKRPRSRAASLPSAPGDPALAVHHLSKRFGERQLFNETPEVRVLAPLADPDATFADLPAVNGWAASESSGYTLAVSEPHTAAPVVARALVSAGADILSLSESRHSLEDVYLELIHEDVEARQP
ncbi:MAG: hypothetical protein WAL22_21150 [Solirubrobacteraceae bacterium]